MTVTLVIGAAASGKSAYAESLCLGHDGPRVYLATMEPFGEEGARRIERHRALREGKGFSTLERTRDVGAAVPGLPRGCTLLLEDVGNLVANELFAEGGLSPRDPDAAAREGARRHRTARSGRCVYGGGHRRRVRRWDALR